MNFEQISDEEARLQELRGIRDKALAGLDEDSLLALVERITDFLKGVQEKFPDESYNAKLFHMLSGSSERPEGFDVPGGLIESFIRKEL